MTRTLTLAVLFAAAVWAQAPRHQIVYREPGRFGGWPANHGIWNWGDEILVGFSAAWFQLRPPDRHQMDGDKPEEPRLARSLDGGATWNIEAPKSLLPPEQGGSPVTPLKKPMDFRRPGFAMTIRLTGIHTGPSRLWYSYDKGRTWNGPHEFPMFDLLGVAARTDYVIHGPREATVFLTAAKSNGREGRPFCARTSDGGLTWKFLSFIGPEPAGFSIMPSTLLFGTQTFLTTVRVKSDPDNWIEAWISRDRGVSWEYAGRPVRDAGGMSGNPPHLIRLKDGRLCLTYGYRSRPYSIRAKLSGDRGETWGPEIVLRDDAAAWDLGYPRSVERGDGKVVTLYYFNDGPHNERFLAATIWNPGQR